MKLVFIFTVFYIASAKHTSLDPQDYLERFGYLEKHAYSRENFTTALLSYQGTFGLSMTGQLDKDTLNLMSTPRCGIKDHPHRLGYRDTAWYKKTLTYYFHNYTPDMDRNQVRSLTEQALKYWSDVTPLKFTESYNGDIVLSFGARSHDDNKRSCRSPFDGPSGVLAHAFFPPDGRLHFDEDETYTHDSKSGVNYLWVATHELGHILGLEHDTYNKQAVMYPYYRNSVNGLTLHRNDIARIQALYGSGTGGGGPDPPPRTPRPPPPPGNCYDRHTNCVDHIRWCRTDGWVTHMSTNCRKTCRYCW